MCLIRSSGCSRRSACRIESSLYVVAVLPPAPPAAAIAQPRGRLGPVPLSPTHPALQPLSRQWRELGDAERHRQKHRRRYRVGLRPGHGGTHQLEERTCLPACHGGGAFIEFTNIPGQLFPGPGRSLSDSLTRHSHTLRLTACVPDSSLKSDPCLARALSEPLCLVSRSAAGHAGGPGGPGGGRPLVGGFRVYRAFTVWPPFAAAWQR